MKIRSVIAYACVFLSVCLYGQPQAAGTVLSAAGHSGGNAQVSINSTLGEVFIFSGLSGATYGGQGFQTLNTGLLTSAIALPEGERQINIYPNPSSGWFFVETEAKISEIRVFSPMGTFLELHRPQRGGIDLRSLPAGTYSLQANINGQLYPVGQIVKID